MMSHLNWFRAGGMTRGTPRRDSRPLIRLMALAFIGSTAWLQAGCRSAPTSSSCNSCGGGGKCSACGFFSRATDRILHRNRVYAGSTPVSDGAVEYGGVVVPGTIPSYSSGGSMGTSPSNVLPSSPNNPIDLEPAPSAKPSSSGTGPTGSSGSGVSKSSYVTRRPGAFTAMRSSRSVSSTPTSMSRAAQDSSNAPGATSDGSLEDNVLDHLPPFPLPKEVTRSSANPPPPPPPAAPAEAKSGDAASAEPTAQRGGAPTEAEFALTIAAEPSPESGLTAAAATGIARFAVVDPKLAGGSSPSDAGLTWLADKGYRTLLDLREPSEVPPAFIAEVARRGLRYVAFPVDLATIDASHVVRFNLEMDFAECGPCSSSIRTAPARALWYIRRASCDRVDAQIARREAEGLGLVDSSAWSAATRYVEKLGATKVDRGTPNSSETASRTASARPQGLDQIDTSTSEKRDGAAEAPRTFRDFLDEVSPSASRARTRSDGVKTTGEHASDPKPSSSSPAPPAANDTTLLRPFAAMILTGLSIPLAYWTRTIVPDLLSRARASLPAPAQRSQSLPHESGA